MTGSTYQAISCASYDWLEIAARWQLEVELCSRTGPVWVDKILTIAAKNGEEFLHLQSGQVISLGQLASLQLTWQGQQQTINF